MHTAINFHLLVLIAAFVCALLATINVPSFPRWSWLPASIMFLIAAMVFV